MPCTIFGRFKGSERARAELLLEAAGYADYVDVGLEMPQDEIKYFFSRINGCPKVILSLHSRKMLSASEIIKVIKDHEGDPSRIYKFAMAAATITDNLAALEACASLYAYKRVVFCYGPLGAMSRAMSPFFGSEWSYASLEKGKEAAPGQIDIGTLRKIQEAFG